MNAAIEPSAHTDAAATDAVIQDIGLILEKQGSPRIAGLVFGLLLVEGAPVSLQDMAARLNVSRASASTNARLLASRGLIRLTTRLGERQDYYELVQQPLNQMLQALSVQMTQTAQALDTASERLPPARGDARDRVRNLADIYRVSADFAADWSSKIGGSD